MELVVVGGISFRVGWFPQLSILRTVPGHARFSVGKLFAIRPWWNFASRQPGARFWETATLSRQNIQPDPGRAERVGFWLLFLPDLLPTAAGARFDGSAARRAKSARIHVAGPKRQAGFTRGTSLVAGVERFDYQSQWRPANFLSRFLVTAMQLRVAEFPVQAFGARIARHSRSRAQR